MSIYAIIITYNGMQWYERCFSSLQASNMPIQIVVIDNASSDGTVDFIKQNYSDIHLIESKENLGFAKANNIGMRYALDNGADYVFLLNQDAWINEGSTISRLVELSHENLDYGILSPLQLYGSGQRIAQDTQAYYLYQSNEVKDDFVSDIYFKRPKELYETQYVCAASWLIPIDIIKKTGGFDPLFYHYGEDDNYIQRIHYWGYKIGICPEVTICHDYENRPASYTSKNLDWKKYILINFANINIKINFSNLLKIRLRNILFGTLLLKRKLLKQSYLEYKYLKSIKNALMKSRAENKIQKPSWL